MPFTVNAGFVEITGTETLAGYHTFLVANPSHGLVIDANSVEATTNLKIMNGATFDTSLGNITINHWIFSESAVALATDTGVWICKGGSIVVQGGTNILANFWVCMDFDRAHMTVVKSGGLFSPWRAFVAGTPTILRNINCTVHTGNIDMWLSATLGTGTLENVFFDNRNPSPSTYALLHNSDSDNVTMLGMALGGWFLTTTPNLTQPTSFHKNLTLDDGSGVDASVIRFLWRRDNTPVFWNCINATTGLRKHTISYRLPGSLPGHTASGVIVGKFDPRIVDATLSPITGVLIDIRRTATLGVIERAVATVATGFPDTTAGSIVRNGRTITETGILYIPETLDAAAGVNDTTTAGDYRIRIRERNLLNQEFTHSFRADFTGDRVFFTDTAFTGQATNFATVTQLENAQELYNYIKFFLETNMNEDVTATLAAGTNLNIGAHNLVVDPGATPPFAFATNTITAKPTGLFTGSIIQTGTATVTLAAGATLTGTVSGGTGNVELPVTATQSFVGLSVATGRVCNVPQGVTTLNLSGGTIDQLSYAGTGTLTVNLSNGAVLTNTPTVPGGGTVNVVQPGTTITFTGLTANEDYLAVFDQAGAITNSFVPTTNTSEVVNIPGSAVGNTYSYVIKRPGYTAQVGTFAVTSGGVVSVASTITAVTRGAGAAMLTVATDANVAITFNGTASAPTQLNIDVGNASVSPQAIYNEVEAALVTTTGLHWLRLGRSGLTYDNLVGEYLFLTNLVRIRRALAGDINAAVPALVFSTDSTPKDAVNGDVAISQVVNTGGGGSGTSPQVLLETTITAVVSPTEFTLATGAPDINAYQNAIAIFTDQTNALQKSFVSISAWSGGSRNVTIDHIPEFTPAIGDAVAVVAISDNTKLEEAIAPYSGSVLPTGSSTTEVATGLTGYAVGEMIGLSVGISRQSNGRMYYRPIVGNTAAGVVTVAPVLPFTPGPSDEWLIIHADNNVHDLNNQGYSSQRALKLDELDILGHQDRSIYYDSGAAAGGDGSKNTPFNTVAAATAALGLAPNFSREIVYLSNLTLLAPAINVTFRAGVPNLTLDTNGQASIFTTFIGGTITGAGSNTVVTIRDAVISNYAPSINEVDAYNCRIAGTWTLGGTARLHDCYGSFSLIEAGTPIATGNFSTFKFAGEITVTALTQSGVTLNLNTEVGASVDITSGHTNGTINVRGPIQFVNNSASGTVNPNSIEGVDRIPKIIYLNVSATSNGDGSASSPYNTVAAAVTAAQDNTHGTKEIGYIGSVTLDVQCSGIIFRCLQPDASINMGGQTLLNVEFVHGSLGGAAVCTGVLFRDLMLTNTALVGGIIAERCDISGFWTLGLNHVLHDCYGDFNVVEAGTPLTNPVFEAFSLASNVTVTALTQAAGTMQMNMELGSSVNITSGHTNGTINVRGPASVTNNSAGGTVTVDTVLNQAGIQAAMTAQGYTTGRAPRLDNLSDIVYYREGAGTGTGVANDPYQTSQLAAAITAAKATSSNTLFIDSNLAVLTNNLDGMAIVSSSRANVVTFVNGSSAVQTRIENATIVGELANSVILDPVRCDLATAALPLSNFEGVARECRVHGTLIFDGNADMIDCRGNADCSLQSTLNNTYNLDNWSGDLNIANYVNGTLNLSTRSARVNIAVTASTAGVINLVGRYTLVNNAAAGVTVNEFDTATELDAQGYTAARAALLANLNATVSSRATVASVTAVQTAVDLLATFIEGGREINFAGTGGWQRIERNVAGTIVRTYNLYDESNSRINETVAAFITRGGMISREELV